MGSNRPAYKNLVLCPALLLFDYFRSDIAVPPISSKMNMERNIAALFALLALLAWSPSLAAASSCDGLPEAATGLYRQASAEQMARLILSGNSFLELTSTQLLGAPSQSGIVSTCRVSASF